MADRADQAIYGGCAFHVSAASRNGHIRWLQQWLQRSHAASRNAAFCYRAGRAKQFHQPAVLHQTELPPEVLTKTCLLLVSLEGYRIKFIVFAHGAIRKEHHVPPHRGKNYGCSRLCSPKGDDQRGPGENRRDQRRMET